MSTPEPPSTRTISAERAIDEIRDGRMVIVVDDEDRENEGDLTIAADLVTPEAINFMAVHGRGLICLALTEDKVAALRLPMMTSDNRSTRGTAFTVSVDARHGVTTGISARERAHTIKTAVRPESAAEDLVTPGHVFPLRAKRGGVLQRAGHTEGAVDLARLAGRQPAGVICEIMRDDGEMARLPDLIRFAERHGLSIVRIADLIQYRLGKERLVRRVAETAVRPRLPGLSATYRAHVYQTDVEDTEYLALVLGDPATADAPLVRVQTASLLRDLFGLGGETAIAAWLRLIEAERGGVLLYVVPHAKGGVMGTLAGRAVTSAASPAAGPADGGAPPARPDGASPLRDFGLGAQVLADLGLRRIRLLTDNPRRIAALEGFGIQVTACVGSGPAAEVVPLHDTSKRRP